MNMSLFGVLGFFRGRQAGIIIKKRRKGIAKMIFLTII